jgi:hypothetical protein
MSCIFFTAAALALVPRVSVKLSDTDGNGRIDNSKISIQNNQNQVYGNVGYQSNAGAPGYYKGGYAVGYSVSRTQGNVNSQAYLDVQDPSRGNGNNILNKVGGYRNNLQNSGNKYTQGYLEGYASSINNGNPFVNAQFAPNGFSSIVNNVVNGNRLRQSANAQVAQSGFSNVSKNAARSNSLLNTNYQGNNIRNNGLNNRFNNQAASTGQNGVNRVSISVNGL